MEVRGEYPADARPGHKRSRSAVLKSVLTGGRQPPSPQKCREQGEQQQLSPTKGLRSGAQAPVSPHRRLLSEQPVLGEIQQNGRSGGSPSRQTRAREPIGEAPLHQHRNHDFQLYDAQQCAPLRPKDKENTTPPSSANSAAATPIWAQFTSQAYWAAEKTAGNRFDGELTYAARESPAKLQYPQPSPLRQLPDHRTDGGRVWNAKPMPSEGAGFQVNASPPKAGNNAAPSAAARAFGHKRALSTPAAAISDEELDNEFERVLESRNIPENMRSNMRSLNANVKAEFIKNAQNELGRSPQKESSKPSFWNMARPKTPTIGRGRSGSRAADKDDGINVNDGSPSKRSRSRSRTFTLSKGEKSPHKRSRSNSRPRSLMSLKNLSSSSLNSLGFDGAKDSKEDTTVSTPAPAQPNDFVQYFRANPRPQAVEVGKIHKLRILLRNESVTWIDEFISQSGMIELLGLLKHVMDVEWRDEHDDLLLHELLLCLKGLSTTQVALDKLSEVESTLFPDLIKMIFDEERKGPSEFNTRGVVFNLLLTYLGAVPSALREPRAQALLGYLSDEQGPEDERPVGFILQMHQRRPYRQWSKEVVNVTREVFWIFLHHLNVVPMEPVADGPGHQSFAQRHFPRERPPVPAAPYVGGVEWEATNYLATHLDLINGLIASLPTRDDRNRLRAELRASGFEKVMGGSLRLCKEKFYGAVHDGLKTWVAAAVEDEWEVSDVRLGPPKELSASPDKSPKKGGASPPKLDLPKLNLGEPTSNIQSEQWLQ